MSVVGPGARRRTGKGRGASVLIILLTVMGQSAEARRLVVRGRLGPIVSRNVSGNPFLGVLPRQSSLAVLRARASARAARKAARLAAIAPSAGFNASGSGNASVAAQMARALSADLRPSSQSGGLGLPDGLFPRGSRLASFGFPGSAPVVAAPSNSAVPVASAPRSNGCGVVVDGRDGHGGGALCRDPRTGGSPGGTARPEAPLTPALGVDGAPTPEACGNLAHAICGGRNAVAEERKIFSEGKRVADAYAAQHRSLGTVLANVVRNPARFFGQYAEYLDFVSKESGTFDAVATRTLDRVREAIDGTAFPAAAKEAMKDKLKDVTMTMTPSADLTSLRTFVAQCGADGMTANAYAVPEKKEIVVCPGMALRAKALGRDLLPSLMDVLAHECGHHCGAERFPNGGQSQFREQYLPYGACLAHRHPEFNAVSMLGESVADAIGFSAVAKELAGKSPGDAFAFLQATASPLCGTQSDGEHPSGAFRINVLLGENPEILQALQCSVPKGLCKLEGGTF